MKKLVIAIDGPAASGKSTTSQIVAERLGYLYVDTGAMYRAMTLKVLRHDIAIDDTDAIGRLADETLIRLEELNGSLRVFLDEEDVTRDIRRPEVTNAASAVSAIEKVREVMVREQRRMGLSGGIVVEGRDIGTIVFPDAQLKIFMVADVRERARRRRRDLEHDGLHVPLEQLIGEIEERDKKDSGRIISPLKKASDAVELDTSRRTVDEQVEFIVKKAREIIEHDDCKN